MLQLLSLKEQMDFIFMKCLLIPPVWIVIYWLSVIFQVEMEPLEEGASSLGISNNSSSRQHGSACCRGRCRHTLFYHTVLKSLMLKGWDLRLIFITNQSQVLAFVFVRRKCLAVKPWLPWRFDKATLLLAKGSAILLTHHCFCVCWPSVPILTQWKRERSLVCVVKVVLTRLKRPLRSPRVCASLFTTHRYENYWVLAQRYHKILKYFPCHQNLFVGNIGIVYNVFVSYSEQFI